MSHLWVDESHPAPFPPTLTEDFPDLQPKLDDAHRRGLHIGTCCDGLDQLAKWFTEMERGRLLLLGYYLVKVDIMVINRILARSEHQTVFACRRHLKHLPKTPWPSFSVLRRNP